MNPDPTLASYHPFDSLPNELLALILIHTSASLFDVNTDSIFTFPSTVALPVCHRWKIITECTPQLWTTIQIEERSKIPNISRYLARSRNLRIDLEIWYTDKEMMRVLRLHASRCRSLKVRAGSTIHASTNIAELMEDYDSIEEFSYVATSRTVPVEDLVPIAGSLRSVYLFGHDILPGFSQGSPSFTALTELTLRSFGDTGAYSDVCHLTNTLRATPLLRRFVLHNIAVDSSPGDSAWATEVSDIVHLPQLTDMAVIGFYPKELIIVLRAIKCSNLRSLEFGSHISTSDHQIPDVSPIDQNWKLDYPHLKEIKLSHLDAIGVRMLHHLPPVETLGVSGPSSIGTTKDNVSSFLISEVQDDFKLAIRVLKMKGLHLGAIRLLLTEHLLNVKDVYIQVMDDLNSDIQDIGIGLGRAVRVEAIGRAGREISGRAGSWEDENEKLSWKEGGFL